MIPLTRLNGSRFAVNSDLIERIDATPDTVLCLVDGTRYVVQESLDEVIAVIREFRSSIVGAAALGPVVSGPTLRVISSSTTSEEG
jgi:flagellar protein FlbD